MFLEPPPELADVYVTILRDHWNVRDVPLIGFAAESPGGVRILEHYVPPYDAHHDGEASGPTQFIEPVHHLVKLVPMDSVSHPFDRYGVVAAEVRALLVQPELVQVEQVIVDQSGDQVRVDVPLVIDLSQSWCPYVLEEFLQGFRYPFPVAVRMYFGNDRDDLQGYMDFSERSISEAVGRRVQA